jgi:hypothetical protein
VSTFTESELKAADFSCLESLGWAVKHRPEIAPDGLFGERSDCREVVVAQRLRDALLPKLIRVEMRVKHAERFLRERRL